MVNLIPPPEDVMQILIETGAYRRGHFIYPNGKHASHYFQMPLAFRYYDNARILSVARKATADVRDQQSAVQVTAEAVTFSFQRVEFDPGRSNGSIVDEIEMR